MFHFFDFSMFIFFILLSYFFNIYCNKWISILFIIIYFSFYDCNIFSIIDNSGFCYSFLFYNIFFYFKTVLFFFIIKFIYITNLVIVNFFVYFLLHYCIYSHLAKKQYFININPNILKIVSLSSNYQMFHCKSNSLLFFPMFAVIFRCI